LSRTERQSAWLPRFRPLLDGDSRRVSDRITAYALYIDPPLGRAGATEDEVRLSGRPALIATRPMTRVGRAVEKGETAGFMKVLVDASAPPFSNLARAASTLQLLTGRQPRPDT
jgi:hypothetical protein